MPSRDQQFLKRPPGAAAEWEAVRTELHSLVTGQGLSSVIQAIEAYAEKRVALALEAAPDAAEKLAALAGWLDAQALQWEAAGAPEDDEDVRAVRGWAALVRSMAPPAPTRAAQQRPPST